MTARFATGLAALHGIVISLLCAFAVMGQLQVRALLRIAAISIGIAAAAAVGLGIVLTQAIDYEYSGEKDFAAYINTWLELSEKDGLNELLFSHWILGKESKDRKPRWSIMRNVLGWGE